MNYTTSVATSGDIPEGAPLVRVIAGLEHPPVPSVDVSILIWPAGLGSGPLWAVDLEGWQVIKGSVESALRAQGIQ